jgi:hypothetical protein
MLKTKGFHTDGNTLAILPIQDALAKGSAFTPIVLFPPEATEASATSPQPGHPSSFVIFSKI